MNFEQMKHNKISEEIVNLVATKTNNSGSDTYFRILVGYHLSQIASNMHVVIDTKTLGKLPVNMYALLLGKSGLGKNFSKNILEEDFMSGFKEEFTSITMPHIIAKNMIKLSALDAQMYNKDPEEALEELYTEYDSLGEFPYSFDSATSAAFRQIRSKAQLAGIGALSLEIDEIANNIINSDEIFTLELQVYDKGLLKPKILKNSQEAKRTKERDTPVPSNLLMFGTPAPLFDGGKKEEAITNILLTGFARRLFFALGKKLDSDMAHTPEQRFNSLTNKENSKRTKELNNFFSSLADISLYNKHISISDEVNIRLIEYQIYCENLAQTFPDHQVTQAAEVSHRYFKTLKLAAVYAFISKSDEVTMNHLESAIKLSEESGKSFDAILTRERPYVKLAKYLANAGRSVTQNDLLEDLPFYKGNEGFKREMMTLAISYGYQNNISITKHYVEGIEFFSGSSLKETSLDNMIVSYSQELAENYSPNTVKFEELHKLTQANGYHWANHHFKDNYRKEVNALQGFNMIVLDIDEGVVSMDTAAMLLKEYSFHMYETKRSTPEHNRYRIIIPISHILKLDDVDFKEFMDSIYAWLPFDVDEQTNQRSRKWLSNQGSYLFNDGVLLDVLPFIPKTTKAEQTKDHRASLKNLSSLEAWFLGKTGSGNRSNQYIKYAYALVDAGLSIDAITSKVMELNSKLPDPMEESEILRTIVVSVSKRISIREE